MFLWTGLRKNGHLLLLIKKRCRVSHIVMKQPFKGVVVFLCQSVKFHCKFTAGCESKRNFESQVSIWQHAVKNTVALFDHQWPLADFWGHAFDKRG